MRSRRFFQSIRAEKVAMLHIWPLMTRVSTSVQPRYWRICSASSCSTRVDELGALIVEDILIIEGVDLLVLGVPAGGIAEPHSSCTARLGVFSEGIRLMHWRLAPLVVILRQMQQLQRLGGPVPAGCDTSSSGRRYNKGRA